MYYKNYRRLKLFEIVMVERFECNFKIKFTYHKYFGMIWNARRDFRLTKNGTTISTMHMQGFQISENGGGGFVIWGPKAEGRVLVRSGPKSEGQTPPYSWSFQHL